MRIVYESEKIITQVIAKKVVIGAACIPALIWNEKLGWKPAF